MHTRYVMGDAIFFPTLKNWPPDPKYTYDNTVITADVEELFSGAYGKSLKKPLFNLFLYTTDKLGCCKADQRRKYSVKLLNIDMPLPMRDSQPMPAYRNW